MQELVDDRRALVGGVEIEENRDEFVAAKARKDVIVADGPFHAVGQSRQELIADGLSITVVDAFEIVEIKADCGEQVSSAPSLAHCVMKPVAKEGSIGESGK